MKIKVSEVQVPKERLRLLGDYTELAQSMSGPVGQINPITVTPLQSDVNGYKYRLVSGNHRINAALENGWEYIEADVRHFENERQEMLAEIDENLLFVALDALDRRKHLDRKYKLLREEGKTLEQGQRADYRSREANFAGRPSTVEERAKQMNISPRSERAGRTEYEKIPWPIRNALEEYKPYIATTGRELYKLGKRPVDEQYLIMYIALHEQAAGRSIGVFDALRKVKRHLTAQLARDVQEPTGTYRTICIDPPWDGKDSGDVDPFGKVAPAYKPMPIEDIRALPVGELAEPGDCHLYLWTTDRMARHAFTLLDAWGFEFKRFLVWVKHRSSTGHYFRGQKELVLFAMQGTRQLATTKYTDVFEGERTNHSEKPEEFYKMVRECSPGPRIELFSRKEREGFVSWGSMERSEQSSMVRAG